MTNALSAGPSAPRRRALFGLLDADGWGWASLKAFLWFVLIIVLLGYIPDRAYYLTVNRTLDVGILAWSPVNLCPAENKTLPCPAPLGAVVPWEAAPAEVALPSGRTDGAIAQIGTSLLYIGGSDGTSALATVSLASIQDGFFGPWGEGPALPAPRSDAAVASVAGVTYLIGGRDDTGAPTDTVWALVPDTASGALGAWAPVEGLVLPSARAGAVAIPVSDGLVVLGGFDASGAPTDTVWKATLTADGTLTPFESNQGLANPVADGAGAQVGDYLWVFGGTDHNGVAGAVQRGTVGTGIEVDPFATPVPNATPAIQRVLKWEIDNSWNLPEARTNGSGFVVNGVLYQVGGSDGTADRAEVYWTVPSATGTITGWQHLDVTDLTSGGLSGAGVAIAGPHAFLIGGSSGSNVLATTTWANLAPQQPFFQVGLLGAVVPALQIEGEIGQQLGYLNAAGVGTVNFVILLLIGWAFAHREQVAAGWRRLRGRGRTN